MIWVIAGTKCARELINFLLESDLSILASTATGYGSELIGTHNNLTTLTKPFDIDDMRRLLKDRNIKLIIDASHPFAKEVSLNAIEISEEMRTPYLRYERQSVEYPQVYKFNSFEEAALYLEYTEGNILLTIGTNNIDIFNKINKARLFARVLPKASSIAKCEKIGLLPLNIVAVQGPFSKEFNRAIYDEMNIEYIVTKDSGDEGGLKEKIDAAIEKGVKVLLVKRPPVQYPEVYYDIGEILNRIKELIKLND